MKKTVFCLMSFIVALSIFCGVFSAVPAAAEDTDSGYIHLPDDKIVMVILRSVSPEGDKTCDAGSILHVSAVAWYESTVKATFCKRTILLTPESLPSEDGYITFGGNFAMPTGGTANKSVGKITFSATFDGVTQTMTSGVITCKKTGKIKKSDASVTPSGGKYINVGSGYISEIVCTSAETFNGSAPKNASIDWSRPTNNYLPKGTLDYSPTTLVTYKAKNKKYATLRAGYRVYSEKANTPLKKMKVIKQYSGTLPDHNEISVLSYSKSGSHTVLKVSPLWKAPFYFKIAPQQYQNPNKHDYRIKSLTCEYIDITFCYATVFNGQVGAESPVNIPADDPLFKSARLIRGKADCTLRLYLKKKGAFYGWDAAYDQNGDLCFDFLCPRKITKANNSYGVNLNGAVILIDIGHGGKDPGALGLSPKKHNEAIENLALAKKIKSELSKIGAKVLLTRSGNTTCAADQKQQILKKTKPDFCVAVHHDAAARYSKSNGFCAYYFQPTSKTAAAYIQKETAKLKGSVYKKVESLKMHTYYMLRCSACPVVLTENGYITNSYDYKNIIKDSKRTQKARAITRGIVGYFKSINNIR